MAHAYGMFSPNTAHFGGCPLIHKVNSIVFSPVPSIGGDASGAHRARGVEDHVSIVIEDVHGGGALEGVAAGIYRECGVEGGGAQQVASHITRGKSCLSHESERPKSNTMRKSTGPI